MTSTDDGRAFGRFVGFSMVSLSSTRLLSTGRGSSNGVVGDSMVVISSDTDVTVASPMISVDSVEAKVDSVGDVAPDSDSSVVAIDSVAVGTVDSPFVTSDSLEVEISSVDSVEAAVVGSVTSGVDSAMDTVVPAVVRIDVGSV